jgi:hypothetical protein
MREISRRGRDALKRIGTESAINVRRVSRFGVVVDVPTIPGAAAQTIGDLANES